MNEAHTTISSDKAEVGVMGRGGRSKIVGRDTNE